MRVQISKPCQRYSQVN